MWPVPTTASPVAAGIRQLLALPYKAFNDGNAHRATTTWSTT
jgi:hypothetical protein